MPSGSPAINHFEQPRNRSFLSIPAPRGNARPRHHCPQPKALDLRPQGDPNRSLTLRNLANRLVDRYKQLGAMQDLDKAIVLAREALNLRPPGQPLRLSTLTSLALCLSARYEQLKAMQDLDEATALNREALNLCPQGHPERSVQLNNLATCLSARYRILGAM